VGQTSEPGEDEVTIIADPIGDALRAAAEATDEGDQGERSKPARSGGAEIAGIDHQCPAGRAATRRAYLCHTLTAYLMGMTLRVWQR
jgi:hypothetical protein